MALIIKLSKILNTTIEGFPWGVTLWPIFIKNFISLSKKVEIDMETCFYTLCGTKNQKIQKSSPNPGLTGLSCFNNNNNHLEK